MLNAQSVSDPGVLVFDTGPVRELIAYSAVDRLRFQNLRSELKILRDAPTYQKFTGFIARFPRRTTTPHVITEISLWIRRTEKKGHSALWNLVYTEFESMRMDEEILKLLQMPQELVTDFGAADASVLQAAATLAVARPIIISIDSALIGECRRAGVPAKDLWEVISEVET